MHTHADFNVKILKIKGPRELSGNGRHTSQPQHDSHFITHGFAFNRVEHAHTRTHELSRCEKIEPIYAFDRQANTGQRAKKLKLIKYKMTGARVNIITHGGEAMGKEFEPTPTKTPVEFAQNQ